MNQIALDFIRQHESCSLTTYQDQGGVWTIGWGSTGPDIVKGITWTQDQCDFRLEVDVTRIELAVIKLLNKTIPVEALAALDSFSYNLGTNALASSHLLQCINDGDYIGATKAFIVWDHIGQIEIKGLLIRRLEEAAMFLRGVK